MTTARIIQTVTSCLSEKLIKMFLGMSCKSLKISGFIFISMRL